VSGTGPGTLTGTVAFKDGTTTIDTETLNAAGQATFTTATLAVGTHPLTASYSGNFPPSSSATLTQTVQQAATSTMVSSSLNPSFIGNPVTLTATVAVLPPGTAPAGTPPTGTVTFFDNGNSLGQGTLSTNPSGLTTASFSTSPLFGGTHA